MITSRDVKATVAFYESVLGLSRQTFGGGRVALVGAGWKINVHDAASPVEPHAAVPTPGSADLCFLLSTTLDEAIDHLRTCGAPVELGPVERTGSSGPIRSVYLRDPDGNLIELSEPAS